MNNYESPNVSLLSQDVNSGTIGANWLVAANALAIANAVVYANAAAATMVAAALAAVAIIGPVIFNSGVMPAND